MPAQAQSILYYQPTTRGLANPDGSKPVRYFGTVYRIPRSEHGTIRQLEWETAPRELGHDLHAADGSTLTTPDKNITERFEVIDQQTGDVWVMYRVPYEPSASAGGDT